MSDIDMIASISAYRHSRTECVTASADSIHFLHPITPCRILYVWSHTYHGQVVHLWKCL